MFSEEIDINGTLCKLKKITFMPSSNHYTIALFNTEEHILLKNIDIKNYYYYLSGVIIEKSNIELKYFIEVHFGYILIYSKV